MTPGPSIGDRLSVGARSGCATPVSQVRFSVQTEPTLANYAGPLSGSQAGSFTPSSLTCGNGVHRLPITCSRGGRQSEYAQSGPLCEQNVEGFPPGKTRTDPF